MNKYWKVVGVSAVAVALLYYPAMKLYKYLAAKNDDKDDASDKQVMKAFLPAYRGKHKLHHRHNTGNA
jgi:hypothetical protein